MHPVTTESISPLAGYILRGYIRCALERRLFANRWQAESPHSTSGRQRLRTDDLHRFEAFESFELKQKINLRLFEYSSVLSLYVYLTKHPSKLAAQTMPLHNRNVRRPEERAQRLVYGV